MKKQLNIPVSTENLIPHKDKIKHIYSFTPLTENSSESIITIKDSMFLNNDHSLENTIIPELFSQVYAAHLEYFDKLNRGPENLGLLVSIKNLVFKSNAFLGDSIKIIVRMESEIQSFQVVSGHVLKNEKEITHGTFKIWIPEKGSDIKTENHLRSHSKCEFNPSKFTSFCENVIQKEILNSIMNHKQKETILNFKKSFSGFSGHFPGFPILPGAVILEAGKFLTELKLKRKIDILRIDNVKFSNIIMPEQDIIFSIKTNIDKVLINVIRNNKIYSIIHMVIK
jgi:3-hydroxymyristoyl/3-hydroxydecanoyl-(acyl carrier protein) dehydratase